MPLHTPILRHNKFDSIEVTEERPYVVQRVLWHVCGLGSTTQFHTHNSSVCNLQQALARRVYNVNRDGEWGLPPEPIPGAFTDLMKEERDKFCDMSWTVPVLTKNQVLDCYSGGKRRLYENAFLSLSIRPVRESDAFLSSFVKMDKERLKPGKINVPRLIQPRSPRYNMSLAPYIKHLEHIIFKHLARMSPSGLPVVFKGMNADNQALLLRSKWELFRDPVAFGWDAERFDQHVSKEALREEHLGYLSFYHGDDRRALAELLEMQIRNVGYCRCPNGTIKYKKEGSRMSGDMNTSLGNCYLMCMMTYSILRRLYQTKFEFVNNGDDCILICERADCERLYRSFPGEFLKFGFTMVMDPIICTEFESIDFCQTHPVLCTIEENGVRIDQYRMVRNPTVVLSKDSYSCIDISSEPAFRKWATAIGDCGLSLTGGCPVFQDYYQSLRKVGKSAISSITHHDLWASGMVMLARGMDRKYCPPSQLARYSYYVAFGILPDEQVELEERYKKWNPVIGISLTDDVPLTHLGEPHPGWTIGGFSL